jgi:hypothetical protein
VNPDGDSVVVNLAARARVASVTPTAAAYAGVAAFDEDGSHVLLRARSDWQLLSTSTRAPGRAVSFPPSVGSVNPRFVAGGALLGAGEHGLAVLPDPVGGTGEPVVVPLAADDGAYWFEVSRDGTLAIARTQRRVLVTELATGRLRWERPATALTSYPGFVNLGFSESGQYVFDLGPDGLTVSATATGEIARTDPSAQGVFIDPSGRHVLARSTGQLALIDLETLFTKAEREGTADSVVWSPDGSYLLRLGEETELWHLSQGLVPAERLAIGEAFTRSAVFTERRLVTSGSEAVALWRLGTVVPSGTVVRVSEYDVEALDPDGTGGVRASQDDSGYTVRDLTGETLVEVHVPEVSVNALVVLFGGKRALVSYGSPAGDGLDLVDLERGRVVRSGTVCGTADIDQLTASSDGSHVLATIDDDTSAAGGERLSSCRTSDGRRVAAMTPRGGVTGVAGPSRDGTLAAVPSQGEVAVVDLRRQRETTRFALPGPARWDGLNGRAVFTPDDRRIMAEWYFGAVLHDRTTERTRSVRRTHVNTAWLPQQINVHPSGRVAVIAAAVGSRFGLSGELTVVDLDSLDVVGPIQVPSLQFVTGVRADPTGETIEVTGLTFVEGGDVVTTRLRVDLADRDLARDACRLLGHTPTRVEWEERLPATEYVEVCREGSA